MPEFLFRTTEHSHPPHTDKHHRDLLGVFEGATVDQAAEAAIAYYKRRDGVTYLPSALEYVQNTRNVFRALLSVAEHRMEEAQ